MPKKKDLDWNEIRKDYEVIGLNPAALAIKYDISANYIYQKARSEGWRKPLDEEIDPEFQEDIDDFIQVDVALAEQKRYLARLHREIDASTSKPGQMKQWIKEGTQGIIDSRRKAMYQMLSLGNRIVALKNAAATLKMIIECENMAGVPKGKKARADFAAQELDDDRFTERKSPIAA